MTKVAKPAHGSLEWLTLRQRDSEGRVRFGASEAPTLMGVNPFATLTDLALSKWSAPEVSVPSPAMERGNVLEPALVSYASTILGEQVFTPDEMFVSFRLIATLDGITESGTTIVEAKTTTSHSCDDPVPVEYFWQVCAQLACVPDAEQAVIVVLDKRMRLGHWVVRRDDAAIARLVMQADRVGEFLDRRELPPEAPLSEKSVKALFVEPSGSVELSGGVLEAVERWQRWRSEREDAERREQEARDEVAAALGRAEVGTVGGRPVVTFKARKGVRRLDVRRLEAEHPELVAEYYAVSAPVRVLRITG